jgi:anti-sigma B factor antagonist
MHTKIEKKEGYTLLGIDGKIDAKNALILEAEVNQIFETGEKNLIFHCAGMHYISSSGLRVFLVALKKAKATNGKLCLCSMQPAIQEIFKMSGFWNLFCIADSPEEACKNLTI